MKDLGVAGWSYWIPQCLTENLWKEDSGGILNMTEANICFWRNGTGEGDVDADTVSSSSIFYFNQRMFKTAH